MSGFVVAPNLPANCESLIIGSKYADILEIPLKSRGLSPIFVPDNPNIDKRLSGHADLSVFHAGGERLILAPYLRQSAFSASLLALGAKLEYADIEQGEKYPLDAQLNACALGRKLLFCSKKTAESALSACFAEQNPDCSVMDVRQGYSRCSVCVVNERALITSDAGIAAQARSMGVAALEISAGHVALPGFEYGFIGGAAFKLAKRRLAFTGLLDGHPDRKAILDFLHRHDTEPVFLTGKPVFDIGSAVPLTEK